MNSFFSMISRKTIFQCIGIVILTLISSFLTSICPVRLGKIFEAITSGQIATLKDGLIPLVNLGVILLFAEGLVIFRRGLMEYIVSSHEANLRTRTIEKMLKMPVSYLTGCPKGERTAQINQGISGLSQLIKIFCNDVSAMVLTVICTLTQVIMNAPYSIAMIMVGYLVLSILISLAQIRSQNGIRESIINQKNVLDGQIIQSIENLEPIRCMNAASVETDRLTPFINRISTTEIKHHLFMGSFDLIKQSGKNLFTIAILFVSIIMIERDMMVPGVALSVFLLFQQILKPLDDIYRFMDETASSVLKAKVLKEMASQNVDSVYAIDSSSEARTSNETDIVFQDVTIENPEKNTVLAHYSHLTIPGKGIVAVKGESGSGKTSMMRSINRFYPYTKGRIMVYGKDLASYSQQELTDTLFYTPQKAFFIAGTIRENLLYGLQEKVEDRVLIEVLKKASLYTEIYKKLRKQASSEITDESILDYRIGEGGFGLSGGEGQRLSIARAYFRKPEMFVFDESTSNLDPNTTKYVLDNIENYADEIHAGIIYISHDEHVIRRCKQIIHLANELKIAS